MKKHNPIQNGEFSKTAIVGTTIGFLLKNPSMLGAAAYAGHELSKIPGADPDEDGIYGGEHASRAGGAVLGGLGGLAAKGLMGGMGGGRRELPNPPNDTKTAPGGELSTKIDGSSADLMTPPVPNPAVSAAAPVSNLTKGPMPDMAKIPGQPTYTRNKLRGQ